MHRVHTQIKPNDDLSFQELILFVYRNWTYFICISGMNTNDTLY